MAMPPPACCLMSVLVASLSTGTHGLSFRQFDGSSMPTRSSTDVCAAIVAGAHSRKLCIGCPLGIPRMADCTCPDGWVIAGTAQPCAELFLQGSQTFFSARLERGECHCQMRKQYQQPDSVVGAPRSAQHQHRAHSVVERPVPQKCTAAVVNPLGYFTIGISYSRKATVDANVEAMLKRNSIRSNIVRKSLGRAARSSLLKNAAGTSFAKINAQLAIQVRKLIKFKFNDAFLDVDIDPTSIRQSSAGKHGMILMEVKICRISDLPRFIRCHLTQYDSATVKDRITSWGAQRLLAWMPQTLNDFIDPQLMEKLKITLPGLMVDGLVSADVGAPNVCFFNRRVSEEEDGGVDGSQYLFAQLTNPMTCPQADAVKPEPLPANGACDPPPLPTEPSEVLQTNPFHFF